MREEGTLGRVETLLVGGISYIISIIPSGIESPIILLRKSTMGLCRNLNSQPIRIGASRGIKLSH